MGDFASMLDGLTDAHQRWDGPVPNRRAILYPAPIYDASHWRKEALESASRIRKHRAYVGFAPTADHREAARRYLKRELEYCRCCTEQWRAAKLAERQRMAAE